MISVVAVIAIFSVRRAVSTDGKRVHIKHAKKVAKVAKVKTSPPPPSPTGHVKAGAVSINNAMKTTTAGSSGNGIVFTGTPPSTGTFFVSPSTLSPPYLVRIIG